MRQNFPRRFNNARVRHGFPGLVFGRDCSCREKALFLVAGHVMPSRRLYRRRLSPQTVGDPSAALTKPPRPRILRGYFLPPGAASGANSPICRKRRSRNRTKRNPGTVALPPPPSVPRPRPGRSPGIPGCANLAPPTKKPPPNRPRLRRPKPLRHRAPRPLLHPRPRPMRRRRNRLPPPRLRHRPRARPRPRRLPRPAPTRKCTPSPGWT